MQDCRLHTTAHSLSSLQISILLHQICKDPLAVTFWRHRLFENFVHLINTEVKFMIANAGHVNVAPIEKRHHLLTLKHRAYEAGANYIAGENG